MADAQTLTRVVEALLFASPEPVALARLEALLEPDGVTRDELAQALERLAQRYVGGGVELREVAGGYQIRTCPDLAPWLARLEVVKPIRFSRPALEVLAVVAYRQPVTRAEVEEVRGVDCGGVLKALLEKGFTRVVGKKDVPGRPLLYGTTRKFLEAFGLGSLGELPSLRDIEEILAEHDEGLEPATPAADADPEPGPAADAGPPDDPCEEPADGG